MQAPPVNIKKGDTNHKWRSFTPQLSKAALANADGMKSGEGGEKRKEKKNPRLFVESSAAVMNNVAPQPYS